MTFISPTKGPMSFEAMFRDITSYMEEDKDAEYKLIVGTDSQVREEVSFVTAVVVHRLGKGGRYYYSRVRMRKMPSLRQRIFYEAHLSLEVASKLAAEMASNGHSELNVEIHLDVGQNGQTRALIKDLISMIVGSGFAARIKPDAYGASQVADKYSK